MYVGSSAWSLSAFRRLEICCVRLSSTTKVCGQTSRISSSFSMMRPADCTRARSVSKERELSGRCLSPRHKRRRWTSNRNGPKLYPSSPVCAESGLSALFGIFQPFSAFFVHWFGTFLGAADNVRVQFAGILHRQFPVRVGNVRPARACEDVHQKNGVHVHRR